MPSPTAITAGVPARRRAISRAEAIASALNVAVDARSAQ